MSVAGAAGHSGLQGIAAIGAPAGPSGVSIRQPNDDLEANDKGENSELNLMEWTIENDFKIWQKQINGMGQ